MKVFVLIFSINTKCQLWVSAAQHQTVRRCSTITTEEIHHCGTNRRKQTSIQCMYKHAGIRVMGAELSLVHNWKNIKLLPSCMFNQQLITSNEFTSVLWRLFKGILGYTKKIIQ